MEQSEQTYYTNKKLVDVLGATTWRRTFERPRRLSNWINFQFQLGVAIGHRSTEQAMLAQHLAKSFSSVMKHHGPLFLALYLKAAKLSLYKALAGDRASFKPGGKLVPVSLSRSGFPRLILPVHRKVLLNEPGSERANTLVRSYVCALDAYKLIVCVDLSSIVDESPLRVHGSEKGTSVSWRERTMISLSWGYQGLTHHRLR